MGVIRLLLAVSVLLAHAGVEALIGGVLAVQIFFMISGYLISFILTEAKTYSSVKDFYVNRALRIFPIYWTVALLALAVQIVGAVFFGRSPLFSAYSEMPTLASYFLGVTNLTLFGQDQVMFMSVQDSTLQYTGDFINSEVQLWQGLLVPPAWSLGVELSFYLVAPFILLSKKKLLLFFALSLALRALFIFLGFGFDDPWSYRFFPTELAVFLAGAISHQFISPKIAKLGENAQKYGSSILVAASFALVVLAPAVPIDKNLRTLLVLGFFLVALPFLFQYQKEKKLDRFLAGMSYPFYIWHWLVIGVLGRTLKDLELERLEFTFLALVVTLALAWLSVRLIEVPIEKLRNRYRSRGV